MKINIGENFQTIIAEQGIISLKLMANLILSLLPSQNHLHLHLTTSKRGVKYKLLKVQLLK